MLYGHRLESLRLWHTQYGFILTTQLFLVGVAGFEPAASWSQTKHSTKLSYTPMEPTEGIEPPT